MVKTGGERRWLGRLALVYMRRLGRDGEDRRRDEMGDAAVATTATVTYSEEEEWEAN